MGDRSADFLTRYDAWEAVRAGLSAREESGDFPPPGAWHDSDDDAVYLLRWAAAILKEGS